MEIEEKSLDDVLIELYDQLLDSGNENRSTRGMNLEILGVTIRIVRPRNRLSRSENRGKPFSAIGELLWYLSGSNKLEFIYPYIRDYEKDAEDGVLPGAYGPRLFGSNEFGINQIMNVVGILTRKPSSRRAVIQIFDAKDIDSKHKEIPCTTSLQFHIRKNVLHMSTTMRSNDAYLGLPHDVFCFTMLQEMLACRLGVELGSYMHHVGSMHIYERHFENAKNYIHEGYQSPNEMPIMPSGNPFELVEVLLNAEWLARKGVSFQASEFVGDGYWSDIIRMIQAHWIRVRKGDPRKLKDEFVNKMYLQYLSPSKSRSPSLVRS